MNRLPSELYRAEQIRELERIAIEELAIPATQLMERAGHAAFETLRQRWPWCRRLVVVCGAGNNGGDGYVVARLARQAGFSIKVAAVAEPRRLTGEAATAWQRAHAAGVEIMPFEEAGLADAEVIVDALLGTGLSGNPSAAFRVVIEAINRAARPVLALDIPSGIDADSGAAKGAAVEASVTLTFIGLKRGLFTAAGPDHCGIVELVSLGLGAELFERISPAAQRLSLAQLLPGLGRRRRASHKGDFGHLLVVGGDCGMLGAALLASAAAGRTGAGRVSLATRRVHAPAVAAARPEVMAHGVETVGELLPLLQRADVVAIGPGLGQGAWGMAMFSRVMECRRPMVVDADALNLLAQEPLRRDNWVLTPHPGEAARLLGCSAAEIEADRFAAAAAIEASYGGVCLLKGAGTLVQDGSALPMVCGGGNPGMASGGMGDLLSGALGALLAQGLAVGDAARLGAALHAAAGDAAVQEGGERGLLASDLLPWLRTLVNPAS